QDYLVNRANPVILSNLTLTNKTHNQLKLFYASADGSRCAGWASYRESSSRGCPHSRSRGSLTRVHRLVLSHALHTGACPPRAPSSPLRKPPAAPRTASLYASHGSHARRPTIARSSSPRDP